MTTLEILRAARALIADPEHWTQRAAARNELGNPVDALGPTACRWCASGAVFRAAGRFNNKGYERAVRALESVISNPYVVGFNDQQTHADVVEMFDDAIAREEEQDG